MTYLGFHSALIVPALVAVLALAQLRRASRIKGRSVLAVCLIALLYTILWDNYLVASEVWAYPPERVLARIGYVPVEEYLFFMLQPLLACWTFRVVESGRREPRPLAVQVRGRRGALFLALLAITGVLLFVVGGRWTYLGLITAWALPPLAGMWWLGHAWLRSRWARSWATILALSMFLWTVDRFAIGAGIWSIATPTSLPFIPLGLPVEEAVFFFLTTVLSVWGVILLDAHFAVRAKRTDG